MEQLLALDIGHRDLGDDQQEDCLAQSADDGEEGEGDDLQTQTQPPRPSIRMTERRESVGAFSVSASSGRLEMYGFFTGPVSAAGTHPVRRIAERDCSL